MRWNGLIDEWHDRQIGAGDDWESAIDRNLETAEIILLLLSASFIASPYCRSKEMERALERHHRKEARVIPVILRPCHWTKTPLNVLQAVPKDGKPITTWSNKDKAFYDVAAGIEAVVEELQQAGAGAASPSPGASAPTSPGGRGSLPPLPLAGEGRGEGASAPKPEPKNGVYIGVDWRDLPDFKVFKSDDLPWLPEMVVIPAGTFLMGSPPGEEGREDWEGPQHRVTISRRFAIGRYAVTFDEYDHFCEVTRREKPKDWDWGRGRRPVINVSWQDATAYAAWLAGETGEPYGLPTEAEWEYVCRAGTTTPFSFGTSITPEQANYGKRFGGKPVPVGSLPANPWGLHEMHGNVWEWCFDGRRQYTGAAVADPLGPTDPDARRAVRGGSWDGLARWVRSACRFALRPGNGDFNLGFRLSLRSG